MPPPWNTGFGSTRSWRRIEPSSHRYTDDGPRALVQRRTTRPWRSTSSVCFEPSGVKSVYPGEASVARKEHEVKRGYGETLDSQP